jgi:hypothetical protein
MPSDCALRCFDLTSAQRNRRDDSKAKREQEQEHEIHPDSIPRLDCGIIGQAESLQSWP